MLPDIIFQPTEDTWGQLTARPQYDSASLEETVQSIINQTRESGDEAVRAFSKTFHGFAPDSLWVTQEEILAASESINPALKEAILLAKKNIETFHRTQIEPVVKTETTPGVECWRKSLPIARVGLYIPGGSAPLFSTLLMLGIPARIAGCKEILVTTPAASDGSVKPEILYVAGLLGITEIYKGGGAQAIAAMAYGTQSVKKVDKIFGPGNQYVTCAKRLVQADGVAIDMLAGPSELAVYADESAIPSFVAADLLSQAEHGADSQVVLAASSLPVAEAIRREVVVQLSHLPRKEIASRSLRHSRMLVFPEVTKAFRFLNQYAPEHLIIASEKAITYADLVEHAGSVFLGNMAPESAGDYASGTNHSLPTNGTARVAAGVSVDSFVKKVTFQSITKEGMKEIGPAIEKMAAAEGLEAHKNAVTVRLNTLR